MRDAELVIEAAKRADVDAVHRIETASFPAPWRREFFLSELQADGRYNIVAKLGGVVVGYLFAMWIFDEMHVNKIAVDAGLRRRGIADALMARCFAFASANGVETISLEVRPRYYPDGESAVVMTRRVM
jgi:[ribosomal protein S18]-alanine N-acetyltransferase